MLWCLFYSQGHFSPGPSTLFSSGTHLHNCIFHLDTSNSIIFIMLAVCCAARHIQNCWKNNLLIKYLMNSSTSVVLRTPSTSTVWPQEDVFQYPFCTAKMNTLESFLSPVSISPKVFPVCLFNISHATVCSFFSIIPLPLSSFLGHSSPFNYQVLQHLMTRFWKIPFAFSV